MAPPFGFAPSVMDKGGGNVRKADKDLSRTRDVFVNRRGPG
jgi:hypothetical protein